MSWLSPLEEGDSQEFNDTVSNANSKPGLIVKHSAVESREIKFIRKTNKGGAVLAEQSQHSPGRSPARFLSLSIASRKHLINGLMTFPGHLTHTWHTVATPCLTLHTHGLCLCLAPLDSVDPTLGTDSAPGGCSQHVPMDLSQAFSFLTRTSCLAPVTL